MGSISKFSAVNTKIRSLEGDMLTKEQLIKLIDCKTYLEALNYLKENTSYSKVFSTLKVEAIHRGQLEVILKKYYLNNFYKLTHYFDNNYKKLLYILFTRYEIEDLKIILRGKFSEVDKNILSTLMTYGNPLTKLNYEQLVISKNIEDVVDKLKDTKYFNTIYPLLKSVNEDGLFRIEMSLDFIYFSDLRKYVNKLGNENRDIIKLVNGEYCDLLNLQWIYRGIKYFKLPPEILLNYTIYDWHRLTREKLKQLCYSKNLEDYYENVSKLPYGRIFTQSKDRDDLLEKQIQIHIKKLFLKLKRESHMNISSLLSYLGIFELEIEDIITIVENKRYNQNNEETIRYVTATL